jgi:hypothetical protein
VILRMANRLAALEAQHPRGRHVVVYAADGETTQAALCRLGLAPQPHDVVIVVRYDTPPEGAEAAR